MWLFTTLGMFSVTRSRTDPTKIQLRARKRSHLLALRDRYLPDFEILDTPKADYPCRILLSPQHWVAVASLLACEIDYSNFKNEVHDKLPGDHEYTSALHSVWSTTAHKLGCGLFNTKLSTNDPYAGYFDQPKLAKGMQEIHDEFLPKPTLRNLSVKQRDIVKAMNAGANLVVNPKGEVELVTGLADSLVDEVRALVSDRNVERLLSEGFIEERRLPAMDGHDAEHYFELVQENK